MIPNQEELFQKTLASLKENPTEQNMFNKFLDLYPAGYKSKNLLNMFCSVGFSFKLANVF